MMTEQSSPALDAILRIATSSALLIDGEVGSLVAIVQCDAIKRANSLRSRQHRHPVSLRLPWTAPAICVSRLAMRTRCFFVFQLALGIVQLRRRG